MLMIQIGLKTDEFQKNCALLPYLMLLSVVP